MFYSTGSAASTLLTAPSERPTRKQSRSTVAPSKVQSPSDRQAVLHHRRARLADAPSFFALCPVSQRRLSLRRGLADLLLVGPLEQAVADVPELQIELVVDVLGVPHLLHDGGDIAFHAV